MNVTGILYSHARPAVAGYCLKRINDAARHAGAEIVGVFDWDAPELDFRRVESKEKSNPHADIYTRIIAGCMAARTNYVALLEHDVLYPASYLQSVHLATVNNYGNRWHYAFGYNANVVRFNHSGYFPYGSRPPLSCCFGNRLAIVQECQRRIEHIKSGGSIKWAELGRYWDGFSVGFDQLEVFFDGTVVDLRLGGNLTGHRTSERYWDKVKGWPTTEDLLTELKHAR